MDASSPAQPHPLFFHDDPLAMGTAISAVRTGRISLKRRIERHDDADIDDTSSSRHVKRLREHSRSSPVPPDNADGRFRESSPLVPASGDTTLVDDLADEHDTSFGQLKGKARDDMCSSSVVSVLLPTHEATSPPPRSPDQRALQLADEIESELRVVQSLVSALIRVYPERARTERERMQADEIYTAGRDIPIPPPRMPNPDVLLPQQQNSAADNLARPCPHCASNNSFDWTCPRPIPNPDTDSTNAWNLENGPPPGHNYCGA
ncbi:hypothetical protein FRC07_000651, partial [Ceratobasidium sp. 392]